MKKILLVTIMFLLFAGVVSASSINGDYKGSPIVKVMSNGKQLETDEVPAMVYDGHTVVPISLLRQLGVSVVWDQATYSVDVNIPKKAETNSNMVESIKSISAELQKLGAQYFRLSYDLAGAYAEINYNRTGNDLNIVSNMALIILKTDADEFWINSYNNSVRDELTKISRNDIEGYSKGSISQNEFINRWKITNVKSPSNPPAQNNVQPNIIVPNITPSVIESKIDGDFEGFEDGKIFKLMNGQIWKQTSFDYKYAYKYSPKVTIYKDGSSYKMIVEGVEKTITVEQLK